jgi:hypothetical protein
MKLVEITDLRIGQVRENDTKIYIINFLFPDQKICRVEKVNKYDLDDVSLTNLTVDDEETLSYEQISNEKLVGFIGITHKIKDGKFVKIPRKEFEENDVFGYFNNELAGKLEVAIYSDENDVYTSNNNFPKNYCKKVGILGVNYEFVNNKLGK